MSSVLEKLYKINSISTNRQYGDKLVSILPNLHKRNPGEEFAEGHVGKMARTVTFQVTDECNLRCSYCYQINKGVRYMTPEIGKKIVDMLLSEPEKVGNYINTNKSPALIMDFIGGEPFLAIDVIREIYEYFLKRAIELRHPWAVYHRLSFSSNGTLYFDEKVQDFLNKYKYNISLGITLDGNKELHDSCRIFPDGSGSYDIANAAIEDWVSKGNYMGSKITIAPENIEYIYKAIVHMYELGYTEVNANCVYEEGWNIDHAKIFYTEMKKIADYIIDNEKYFSVYNSLFNTLWFMPQDEKDVQTWCGGTGDMLAFDPDGKAYPCLRYMESSLGCKVKPLIIGDVEHGLEYTDEQKQIVKDMLAITRKTQSTEECFNCPVAAGCSYCSAYNYQVFGTPNSRAIFICVMHKARALANVYFWNRIFTKEDMPVYFHNYLPDEDALKIISEDELNMLKKLELDLIDKDAIIINPDPNTKNREEN